MDVMKLSLDRENILEFNVDIQGYGNNSITKPPKVRMILEQNELGFCVDATKEGKTYSVIIPEMKNVMESGLCDVRMEVIIENKYFVPWESQIEFNKEVQVAAAPVLKNDPETEEAKKTIDDIRKKNENKKVKKLDKALSRADVFDRTVADIMEHDRVTNDMMGNLTINNKEKKTLKSASKEDPSTINEKLKSRQLVVKEGKLSSNSKEKEGLQLIVDMKPNGSIKKENKNVDNIVDDLKSLAKKIH